MKRNVIVVSTNTQSRRDFEDVEVTTLADVKALLDEAGIDYTNQAFYEGVSKAEYKSDDSILPTNMPFKGGITNDLVFQLSNASKKISSGAANPERQKCFDFIKEHNLHNEIKEHFGLMYTSVSTGKLAAYIDEWLKCSKSCIDNNTKSEGVTEITCEGYLLKQVISALTKMGYVVAKPKEKVKSLSMSDVNDILGR